VTIVICHSRVNGGCTKTTCPSREQQHCVTELPLKGDLIISTCVLWPMAVV